MQVQTVSVFLASPGGVEAERKAVRAMVDELNGSLRQVGWELILLGWEERGPTGGRAQADINADVRRCDVFLGILWNRWGRPTGEHQSGFEEEWTVALERHRASGRPDLWLYVKRLSADAAERAKDDAQLAAVLEFRAAVEDGEFAFYKPFRDVDEFTTFVRRRLLDEVFERTGLTRTDLGALDIDWAAAYNQEPVDLIPDGHSRVQLADELEQSNPAEAARLVVELADDAEKYGFAPTAEQLRERACNIWLAAGKTERAVALLRRLLTAQVWELRAEEADMLVRQVRDHLPPELDAELRAWRACAHAANEPEQAVAAIDEVLPEQHGFALDADTMTLWRAVRWRSLLDVGAPETVVEDETVLIPKRGHVELELALLRADALRAVGDVRANMAWQELRLLTVDAATEQPEIAAWIATRVALDALTREDLRAAEVAYADAATRWTNVPGAVANAALAFFSAQAVVQLRRDWSFSGWSWRPIAAQQRGGPTGLAACAEELEREALHKLLERRGDEIALLRGAIWCYKRAGFAHGALRCSALLADAYVMHGNDVAAIALHCRLGQRSAAQKLAAKVNNGRAVADRMAEGFPSWATEARFAVLGRVGTHASPQVAARLATEAIDVVARGQQSEFDKTPEHAAEALAALAVAVEDPAVLRNAVQKLEDLAGDPRYTEAKTGRVGLRMLDDIAHIDAADALVARFASDDRPDEPDPVWVSERLDAPQRLQWVRAAALGGHRRALAALLEAGVPARDNEIRALCVGATKNFLSSNIGMTPDGSGIWGLLDLGLQGHIAAATGDDQLRHAAAERLLVYAADSRWPMVNRVSAVRGLYAVAKDSGDVAWIDELRLLARPQLDLDDEAPPHMREMWAQRGDLEAIALTVCALLGAAEPPTWLDEAVEEARFDARVPPRVSAWEAAGERAAWFDTSAARHALRDDSARVRVAALHAWRKHRGSLPRAELQRLAADPASAVRLTLVRLLEDAPDEPTTTALLRDPDAYVRGIARSRLVSR